MFGRSSQGAFAPVLALAVLGLSACDKPKPPPVSVAPQQVAPPDDLLVDGIVANPKKTWAKVLREAGPAALLLPESAAAVLSNLAGIEGTRVPIVDDASVARLVVVGEPGSPGPLLSLLVPRGVDAAGLLFDGDVPRAAARDAGAFVLAVPKGGDTQVLAALGSHGGQAHVLLGPSTQVIERGGAFAMGGSLPCVAEPHDACARITGRAFRSLGARAVTRFQGLRGELEKADAESRAAHGGKEPDFGDPAAILGFADAAVSGASALLADVGFADSTLDIDGPMVRAHAEVLPTLKPGGLADRISAMHEGPKNAALDLPFDIDAALVTHVFPDGKPEGLGKEVVDEFVRKILGTRLDDAGATTLRNLVTASMAELAAPLVVGVVKSPSYALLLSASLRKGSANSLPDNLLRVLQVPAISGPLGIARARATTLDIKGASRAGRIEIVRRDRAPKSKGPMSLELGWAIARERLFVSPERSLDSEPMIHAELERLPAMVSTVLVLRPQRLDPSRVGSLAAPALLALGKRERALVVDVSVGTQVLRELLRQRSAL
jgi:hypothetical protein